MYLKPEKGTHFGRSFPFHIDPYRQCPCPPWAEVHGVLGPAYRAFVLAYRAFVLGRPGPLAWGVLSFLSYTI